MAIPSYQEIMLPALVILLRKGCLPLRELANAIARELNLTDTEKGTVLSSRNVPLIVTRTSWAVWYMTKANLTFRPKKGYIQITAEGEKLLSTKPNYINNKVLATYPTFVQGVIMKKASFRASESQKKG